MGRKGWTGIFGRTASLVLLLLMGCSTDAVRDGDGAEAAAPFLGVTEWTKNFGGSGEDTIQAVISTNDGGFALLGTTESVDGDLHGKDEAVNDYWLIKLDAEGNLQWNRTYGGSKDDLGQSIVQTMDGGYAVTGYAMSDDGDGSNNEGFHDNWILKLDALGGIEWERSFGFSGHDHSYDLVQTTDGGFFFVGFLDITAARADGYEDKGQGLTRHGVGEFWGTKIDAQGNLEWRRYFGGTNNDRAHAVVEAPSGGFLLAGFSESVDFDISATHGSYDFWVVKVSASGELLWERSYGGSGIDIAQDIAVTKDGAYIVTGRTFSADGDVSENRGEADIWLIKIDDSGTLLWERTYGGSGFDAAENVTVTEDGGFLVVGNSRSMDGDLSANSGENDIWIFRTDRRGGILWQKSVGGTGLDFGFDALETDEGRILLAGETASQDFPGITNRGKTDAVLLSIR